MVFMFTALSLETEFSLLHIVFSWNTRGYMKEIKRDVRLSEDVCYIPCKHEDFFTKIPGPPTGSSPSTPTTYAHHHSDQILINRRTSYGRLPPRARGAGGVSSYV